MRMKTYQTKRHEVWIRLMKMKQRLGHVVEVDGVAGHLDHVSGRWNWLQMEGHVTLKLRESDRTQLGCVSNTHLRHQGGENGIA